MSSHLLTYQPVVAADLPAIANLNARAFSPGRFARTAYRVREGLPPFSAVCMTARIGPELVAAVRYAPVTIGEVGRALMLGPLAVEPALKGQGIGRRLVAESLHRAQALGYRAVILVGDLPYYERFGFKPVPAGAMVMPGPVDPARLLALELVRGALADYRGPVAADRSPQPAVTTAG